MKRIALAATLLLSVSVFAQVKKFAVSPDVGNLYAYDANDNLVGAFTPVATANNSIGGIIRMEVADEGMIFLPVARRANGLHWSGPGPMYTTRDCTGTAYHRGAQVDSIGDKVVVIGLDGALYIDELTGKQFSGFFNSYVELGEAGRVCREGGSGTVSYELREIAKLDDEFKPPFSLEVAVKIRSLGVGR